MSRAVAAALVAVAFAVRAPTIAAQQWRGTAQVGRVTSGTTPVGNDASATMVLGVNRSAPASSVGLSAALPIGDNPFWAVVAGSQRAQTQGRAGLLLDLSAQGFVQRTSTQTIPAPGGSPLGGTPAPTRSTVNTAGGGLDARGGAFLRSGIVSFEIRGGAVAEASETRGVAERRVLPAADARLSLLRLPVMLSAETRTWWNGAERHAYAGGGLQFVSGPVAVWGPAGEWLTGGVNGVTWAAGGRAEVVPRLDLVVAARGNWFEPLYRTTTGTTFSVGLSALIGGAASTMAPVAARRNDGLSEIRIGAHSADGPVSIAGDFTDWKPVPMQRNGGHWVYVARLAPGVYHYSFVSATGKWFLPKSVAGRQSDGMGGETAVLVVRP